MDGWRNSEKLTGDKCTSDEQGFGVNFDDKVCRCTLANGEMLLLSLSLIQTFGEAF